MAKQFLVKISFVLVCVIAPFFSAYANASSFEFKLALESAGEGFPVRITTQLFVHELKKTVGGDFPSEALSDENYKRLKVELRTLSEQIDADGKNINELTLNDTPWRQKLNILQSRVLWLLDATLTKRCSKLGIDLESAKSSDGDWKEVKADSNWDMARQPSGTAIKPSSHLHTMLYRYYRLGCSGKKDLEMARKVLFDISDLEPPNPSNRSELRPEIRHCNAEIWARFGIGGTADQARADEFSKRFTTAAFFFNSPDTPTLREKLAERYPDAAKNNFKCPKPHDSFRIDPRDPWNDLW